MANKSTKKRPPARLKPESLLESIRSRFYLHLAQLFNGYVQDQKDLAQTREDILRGMPYHGAIYETQSLFLINHIFQFEDNTDDASDSVLQDMQAALIPPDPELGTIPLQMTLLEKRWLRTFLDTPAAGFLLSDELRGLLMGRLQDVVPFDKAFWQRNQLTGDDLEDAENLSRLRLIIAALRRQEALQIKRGDRTQVLLPVRLRYNALTNRYSLIAQEAADTASGTSFLRLHLHALAGLRAGKPMTKREWSAAQKAYDDYCQAHRAYFHLRLTDERNARERCYASFAAFDKKSYCERDGSYRLIISYCTFDEADVVNRLLALGPDVTVLPDQPDEKEKDIASFGVPAGTRLREQIVERLRAALPFYVDASSNEEPLEH